MVRRWSYINNNYINILLGNSFFILKKRYKLINFKSSVSLKRFNKKYTKFKRKALNRIKHINNWTIYHNIFKYWSKDYFFFKKTAKIQFLQNIFFNNYLFYNFIRNRNTIVFVNDWNFIFYNFIKKNYLYYQNFKLNYLNNNTKTNLNSNLNKNYIFSHSYAQIENSSNLSINNHALLFYYAEQYNLYPYTINNLNKNNLFKNIFLNLYKTFFILKIKIIIEYYKNIIKFLFFLK